MPHARFFLVTFDMIAKSYILENISQLETLYAKSTSGKRPLYYSKLAIIELCGWIEESMDDIIKRCAVRKLSALSNRTYVNDVIVKKTYGFDYDQHFRTMLGRLIGLVNVEKLENRINQTTLLQFKATLGNLKVMRDAEAHTHLKSVTRIIDSPSLTKRNFHVIYGGLKEFEIQMRRMNL